MERDCSRRLTSAQDAGKLEASANYTLEITKGAEVSETLEEYSTVSEVAARFKTPASTLYRWRSGGTGPRAIRVGRKLLYPESAVQDWLRALELEQADARSGSS